MSEEMNITLKEARKRRGILQKYAAEKVGITVDMLKRIEAGKTDPRFTVVVRLANLYEVPINCIFVEKKSA